MLSCSSLRVANEDRLLSRCTVKRHTCLHNSAKRLSTLKYDTAAIVFFVAFQNSVTTLSPTLKPGGVF
jgi:hypothetical protein